MEKKSLNTGIDLAFKLVLMNGKLPVGVVARATNLGKRCTERLFEILERKKMVKMRYKIFGETEIMTNNGHEEVKEGMKKVRISDWIVECPRLGRSVMFKTSCQNCRYLRDVNGDMCMKGGNFEFRPENVVCAWKEKPDAMQSLGNKGFLSLTSIVGSEHVEGCIE